MDDPSPGFGTLADTARDCARYLVNGAANRLELLEVELQEEHQRVVQVILLALSASVAALLGAGCLTAAIVVLLWGYSPAGALAAMACVHGLLAFLLHRKLVGVIGRGQAFPESMNQLRKDRECLDKMLS